MDLNPVYYVEYRACPTSYSATITVACTLHRLIEFVTLVKGFRERVELSEAAKRDGHAYRDGVVVERIYTESKSDLTIRVHYKDGGYGASHISEWLRGVLVPAPVEVLE